MSRRSYKAKFDKLGVQADVVCPVFLLTRELNTDAGCTQDEIYGSAYVAAVYISTVLKLLETQKVYIIGMGGLEEELAEEGVAFAGGTVSSSPLSILHPSHSLVFSQ
jgi:4-nitrophenyl phosphatase